jgi:hypothetical protein
MIESAGDNSIIELSSMKPGLYQTINLALVNALVNKDYPLVSAMVNQRLISLKGDICT